MKKKFKKNIKKKLDLKNPKLFNELIQWRKLYDHNPLYTLCADKLAVRKYVKERVGSKILVPLICSARTWNEINFSSLPESFIIKATHGCGWNQIVYKKSNITEAVLRQTCEKWLTQNYYFASLEWQYKDIPPHLIVEKLLLDSEGHIPNDYKLHCFNINHKIEVIIGVNEGRFDHHTLSYYDSDWHHLPFTVKHPLPDRHCARPENLDEIIHISKKLAKEFSYVRVDLYNVSGKVYFGELTFTSGSGFNLIDPEEWDAYLGAKAIESGMMKL